MDDPLELWTNLWWPPEACWGPTCARESTSKHETAGVLLSEEERRSLDASFREAIGTTELTLAIALGRSASAMSEILYVYYEPVAYLVVVLDPFEKKVSLSAKDTNWHVLYDQFNALIEKAETLLRQDRLFDAVGTCIREGCEWVEAMRNLGRP